MGDTLDANVVYGFILDRYIDVEEIPKAITKALTVEQVADLTYVEIEEVDGGEYIRAILTTKFTALDAGYPGTEHNEEMVVYVKSTEQSAYYTAQPFSLNEISAKEKSQIEEIASLFGKEPQWLLYPTYG